MQQPELTVSREQVTEFLRSEFEAYLDNSVSPEPTNGIHNYATNILALNGLITEWARMDMVPPDSKSYFSNIQRAASIFHLTLREEKRHDSKNNNQHYDSLVELSTMPCEIPDLREYSYASQLYGYVNTKIPRQIKIANIIFDPEKRNADHSFRAMIWGPMEQFESYIDSLD